MQQRVLSGVHTPEGGGAHRDSEASLEDDEEASSHPLEKKEIRASLDKTSTAEHGDLECTDTRRDLHESEEKEKRLMDGTRVYVHRNKMTPKKINQSTAHYRKSKETSRAEKEHNNRKRERQTNKGKRQKE